MQRQYIDEYDLGPVLGAGTVGTIYVATHKETGKTVAIKKLHPSVCKDRLIRSRFRREMLVLDRLQHPNIIAYYGGGEVDGQLYYVMELVDGGTVKELLQDGGPFIWPIVVEIGRQLCSALQFAHNHGVIHRDVKPGNLFLTQEAEIKLGDFGIARDLRGTDIGASGTTVGTHAYMAPEQITGDENLSDKADLYSMGCCLFEMLVGRPPFVGQTAEQIFDQHLKAKPIRVKSVLPDCPGELDEIIYQLLAKKPEDRPFNARQVQAVMLQLCNRESAQGSSDAGDQVSSSDSSGMVILDGHKLLREQIVRRRNANANEVGWGMLLAVLGILAAAGGAAVWFGK